VVAECVGIEQKGEGRRPDCRDALASRVGPERRHIPGVPRDYACGHASISESERSSCCGNLSLTVRLASCSDPNHEHHVNGRYI
jgi:hypothetical protein